MSKYLVKGYLWAIGGGKIAWCPLTSGIVKWRWERSKNRVTSVGSLRRALVALTILAVTEGLVVRIFGTFLTLLRTLGSKGEPLYSRSEEPLDAQFADGSDQGPSQNETQLRQGSDWN